MADFSVYLKKYKETGHIDAALIHMDAFQLRCYMRTLTQIILQHHSLIQHEDRHDKGYSYTMVNLAVHNLCELINECVASNAKTFMSVHHETTEITIMRDALRIAQDAKIKFHESEHRAYGAHWGTGTGYYRFKPLLNMKKFLRLHLFNDKDSIMDFNDEYRVEQAPGQYFIIDDEGNSSVHNYSIPVDDERVNETTV